RPLAAPGALRALPPQAGEQIRLRQLPTDAREVQLVVVGAPGGPLDLVRDAEERPVGINLGGVGAQRVVTHLQEVAHIDTRGEQAVLALVVALEHLLELLTGLSLLTKVP